MAINQNHLFEELDGVKCAIVEKNADQSRVDFLRELLSLNHYTVVVVPSPPPKGAAPLAEGEEPPAPTSFTIGVTDVTFNATNAVFGRLLRNAQGHVVTLAYWQQKDNGALDATPYYDQQ